MKILLVEDEHKLATFIKKGFHQEGYEIDVAYDGQLGKQMYSSSNYNIVILDVNLPIINGFTLCKFIREENAQIPILMLTALDGIQNKELGFESGADDYLVKPFEFKELLLRVRSLTKRSLAPSNSQQLLKIADLTMDRGAKTVRRGEKLISLTQKEYALLEYLLLNKGKVMSKIDISENVWDINFDTGTNIVEVYVNYLRKKIDKDFPVKLLHTIFGMGYVIREDNQ